MLILTWAGDQTAKTTVEGIRAYWLSRCREMNSFCTFGLGSDADPREV